MSRGVTDSESGAQPGAVSGVPVDVPRPPSASRVRTAYITHPNQANVHGTVFGGHILRWFDEVGAMAAVRHCRQPVVTALIDAVAFEAPLRIGDFAIVRAQVTRAWTTSMELHATVHAEHPLTGEYRRVAEAFLTFVAVDDESRPQPVCPIEPETEDEQLLYEGAARRRAARLVERVRREETGEGSEPVATESDDGA